MAAPGKGRVVGIVLLIAFLLVGFIFFDPLGSKNPEGSIPTPSSCAA